MKIQPGEQVCLNGKPAVIVSVLECPTCEIVTLFWPATLTPPVVAGKRHPGVWRSKAVTLWHYRDDESWWWDYQHRARVEANQDAHTHVQLSLWLDAFARTMRPPVVR